MCVVSFVCYRLRMLLNAKSNQQQTFHNRKYRQPASHSVAHSVYTDEITHTINRRWRIPPHKRKPYRNISISNWKFNNGKVHDHANNSPSLMDESNSLVHIFSSRLISRCNNELHWMKCTSFCSILCAFLIHLAFSLSLSKINGYFEIRAIFSSSKWCSILRMQYVYLQYW